MTRMRAVGRDLPQLRSTLFTVGVGEPATARSCAARKFLPAPAFDTSIPRAKIAGCAWALAHVALARRERGRQLLEPQVPQCGGAGGIIARVSGAWNRAVSSIRRLLPE